MNYRMASLIVLSVVLSGCATVTRGTREVMVIESEPSGAAVEMSNGLQCTTPCAIKIKRRSSFVVTFTMEGFETMSANVDNDIAPGGAAGVAGNVLVGGLIGLAVDAGTGAARRLVPNPLQVTLVPVGEGGGDPKESTEASEDAMKPEDTDGREEAPTS